LALLSSNSFRLRQSNRQKKKEKKKGGYREGEKQRVGGRKNKLKKKLVS